MKIGFDAKRAFNNKSGLGNYSRDLIRSLLKNFPENEYYLYSPSIKSNLFSDTEKAIVRKPMRSPGKIGQALWRSYQLGDLVKKDNINLFHGLSHELPIKINKKGIPTVVTIHDLIFMHHPEWYNPFDVAIYRRKFRHSCRISDRIIAVSQQTKNDIVDYFKIEPEKIQVIYQACNERFRKILTEEEKKKIKTQYKLPDDYLLYVGTIEKRKNLLTLLKAVHLRNIKVPIVAIGRQTSYFREIQQFHNEHPEIRINFLNEISVYDLPGIYQMASIFIYPSLFEGFGIPVLEALYSGTPVITSEGGCFRETGGPGSIYTDPLDFVSMAEAIEKVLNDNSLRTDMVKKGIAHASLFSNEKMASETMKLYKSLINAG